MLAHSRPVTTGRVMDSQQVDYPSRALLVRHSTLASPLFRVEHELLGHMNDRPFSVHHVRNESFAYGRLVHTGDEDGVARDAIREE
jgi:hypothetical protein